MLQYSGGGAASLPPKMTRRDTPEAKEESNGDNSKGPRRRRRIFGGKKKTSRRDEGEPGDGRAALTDGVMYGIASWVWHATNFLHWNTVGIGGEAGEKDVLGRTGDTAGLSRASGQAAGVTLAFALAAAGLFFVRYDAQ